MASWDESMSQCGNLHRNICLGKIRVLEELVIIEVDGMNNLTLNDDQAKEFIKIKTLLDNVVLLDKMIFKSFK